MKILHTSDWHLGKTLGNESLTESFRYFFGQLYQMIEEHHVGAVIVAGDIYDSSVSNAEAIGLYNELAREVCLRRGCRLIVIAGNHDGPERLAGCSELLDAVGLHVRGRLSASVEPVLLDGGRVAVYPIPFFNRQEAAFYFGEKKRLASDEEAARLVCGAIREKMDPDRFNIAVSHSLVTGYELSDSDHAASIGGASAISGSVFDGFDYVALGHIHKPVVISDTVRYSGSPLKYCFGEKEERQTKGVVLLDTESGEQRFLPLRPLRDVVTAEGSYEELLNTLERNNDYLFLRLTDRRSGRELYDELKSRFPGLVELRGIERNDAENGRTSITLEELESMDEISVMKQYFADDFSYEPDDGQIALFQAALEELEKGGDEQ